MATYQSHLKGSPTNPLNIFYNGDDRIDENTASQRIVDYLTLRLNPHNISLNIEEYTTAKGERCDIVLTYIQNGQPKKLVIKAKGQWNKELYSAASTQLFERYSQHPNAEKQGIYLVCWYRASKKVANKSKHNIQSSEQLKEAIEKNAARHKTAH